MLLRATRQGDTSTKATTSKRDLPASCQSCSVRAVSVCSALHHDEMAGLAGIAITLANPPVPVV
jgi:hypothetical protein